MTGFLRNYFLSWKPEKNNFRRREPGLDGIEAYDLGKYNTGPLTKLEILDKGC